ncbi:MAG: hypothetical protein E6K18_05685 [Methanobacteriota archaeon]|nr:MAG: hypothetical protein E6K18_05685 [Euryarchaeota archaeon]
MTNYEDVLNHLMFHKALTADHESGERINQYLQMVHEIEGGHYLAVRDPMEKAIAAAFELVIAEQFDPWDIDLAAFTKLYLEKVRDDGVVNFVTAGKLVAMAWSILRSRTGTSASTRPTRRTYSTTRKRSSRAACRFRRRFAGKAAGPSPSSSSCKPSTRRGSRRPVSWSWRRCVRRRGSRSPGTSGARCTGRT